MRKAKSSIFFFISILAVCSIRILAQTNESQNEVELVSSIIDDFTNQGVFDRDAFVSILENEESGSTQYFKTIDSLLRAYILTYLPNGGVRNQAVEEVIQSFLDSKILLNIILQAVKDHIVNNFFNDIVTATYSAVDQYPEDSREQITFVYHVYRAIHQYHTVDKKTNIDWDTIASHLQTAQQISSVSHFYPVLIQAYRHLGEWRLHYDLASYYYYNMKQPNLFAEIGLFFSYLRIPGEKVSYNAEKQAILEKLHTELIHELPELRTDVIEDISMMNYEGETLPLSPTEKSSPLYGKKGIIVYFNTGCEFCKNEIEILKRLEKTVSENCQIVLINTMYRNKGTVGNEVIDFVRENSIPFDVYIDVGGVQGVMKLGISGVPCIILANPDGSIERPVKFKYDGHLEMKLRWLLSDFVH